MKAYHNLRAIMNNPLLAKARNLIEQEFLDPVIVKLGFGNVSPAGLKVIGQFRIELSLKQPHSDALLLQHEDFNVTHYEV